MNAASDRHSLNIVLIEACVDRSHELVAQLRAYDGVRFEVVGEPVWAIDAAWILHERNLELPNLIIIDSESEPRVDVKRILRTIRSDRYLLRVPVIVLVDDDDEGGGGERASGYLSEGASACLAPPRETADIVKLIKIGHALNTYDLRTNRHASTRH